MATSTTPFGREAFFTIKGKNISFLPIAVYGFLFPLLIFFGGSTSLLNWGPGLLMAGMACILLLGKDRGGLSRGRPHVICLLLLFGLLLIRAWCSSDVAAAANNSALIALAAVGYLIGKLAGWGKSRAMLVGLSAVAVVNLICTLIQMTKPEWNLIYPQRSGLYPSGLFAHYNYATACCLGMTGLLVSRACNEKGWGRSIMIGGAVCAAVAIPFSLSRGGTLALAFMVAGASALLLARAFHKSKSLMSTWLPVGVLIALAVIFATCLVPLINRDRGADGFYADTVRINFWTAATRISMDHPWLGGGPGNFSWNIFQMMDSLQSEPDMAHNEALQVAVDYGYPALTVLVALIAWPVILCFWRFLNNSDVKHATWAAVGLLAMLLQSNFDFVLHTAPGAFIAAMILGQISRSVWENEAARGGVLDRRVPEAAIRYVDAYFGGSADAVSRLIGLLVQSKEEEWKRASYRLTYWSKVQNEESLRGAMGELRIRCSDLLQGQVTAQPTSGGVRNGTGRSVGILENLALAGCAIPVLCFGGMLTKVLADLWTPVYSPAGLAGTERFDQLMQSVKQHPGLGLDRKLLTVARDCIHQFRTLEDREAWATSHRSGILRAVPGWKTDPGSALLLAEIVGWTGDSQSALYYYDHAIATQGANESLFRSQSFKGQYLYELFVSAGASGQTEQQKYYARQALICLHDAAAAMAKNRCGLDPFFAKMLQECENYSKQDT